MRYYEGHDGEYQRRLKSGQVAWDPGAYETFDMLPLLQEFLAISGFEPATSKMLDLGCGTGALAVFLAKQGFDVLGVDISPTAIEEARWQAAAREVQVDFQVADVCTSNLPEESFDLITDNHFLHCIVFSEERANVLGRIYALLRPGGQYWIETMVGHPAMRPRPEWHMDAEGITWAKVDKEASVEGCIEMDRQYWMPIRRIRNSDRILEEELRRAGFEILWQDTLPPKDENDTGAFRARCRRPSAE